MCGYRTIKMHRLGLFEFGQAWPLMGGRVRIRVRVGDRVWVTII